ncbi:MAG: restriction endonuclease [Candidatus Daviesbacteria bacterium]|nr:restriction endonuclease [Candidatus Daviesbacteria bacterium]
MNLTKRNLNKNNSGCFTELFFVIFYFICIFIWFPYSFFIGFGVFFLRKHFKEVDKTKELEKQIAEYYKEVDKRLELLKELKGKFDKNSNPDEIIEHRDIQIEIFRPVANKEIARIRGWDGKIRGKSDSLDSLAEEVGFAALSSKRFDISAQIEKRGKQLVEMTNSLGLEDCYFSIQDAKDEIDMMSPFLRNKEEYLAEEEIELRKKENIHFLANAYKQRKNMTAFKQNLSIIDNLLNLTPIEFEKWVKSNVFEKEGWLVTETKITGDGGIDLVLKRKDEHSIVQCKRYKHTIGEPSLRDFYGTMISEGVSKGYFVTTGLFSLSALKFAENKPIELIDRRVLAQKYLS